MVVPPELTKDRHYTSAGDIYCYGLILFELLTGKHPYAHELDSKSFDISQLWQKKEQGKKPSVPNADALQQNPFLAGLLNIMNVSIVLHVFYFQKCLEMDESKRPTYYDVLMDIRSITDSMSANFFIIYFAEVFRVSHKIESNCYPSLKEALFVRSLVPTERVSIFVDEGHFTEEEDTQLNIAHTHIVGCKGSTIKGHFLTISKNDVELDNIRFEGKHQDFHVNITFCSPSVKRCQIMGGLMIFGDDNTKPTICYNVIHNANSISTLNTLGTFKHNQFHMCSHHGKHHPAEAHGVGLGIDTMEAKSIALALGNQDVSGMLNITIGDQLFSV